jgi:hypothetical protein
MQKVTTIEHGGKVYEVRAIPTLNGWKVRIFVRGIPLTPRIQPDAQ